MGAAGGCLPDLGWGPLQCIPGHLISANLSHRLINVADTVHAQHASLAVFNIHFAVAGLVALGAWCMC